jgi:hypothetical protein
MWAHLPHEEEIQNHRAQKTKAEPYRVCDVAFLHNKRQEAMMFVVVIQEEPKPEE